MDVIRKIAVAALAITTMLIAVPAANASALPNADTASIAPAATVTVVVAEPNFNPAKVIIKVGDTVRWVNKDTIDHTTTSDTGLWDELLSPGESFSFTFTSAGTFRYHCEILTDMHGTVVVKR